MGIETAIIAGAVIGGGASLFGASKTAAAQTAAGNATLQATQLQIQYEQQATQEQLQQRQQAISDAKTYGAATPQELASVSQILSDKTSALTASMTSIGQQQQQLDAMDPTIKASGQDLLDLLNGKASAMLAPVQAQQAKARQSLVDNLSATMGPGYASTSAGAAALLNFDQSAAVTNSQIQQTALSQAGSLYSGLQGTQANEQASVTSGTQNAENSALLADQSVLQENQLVTNRTLSGIEGAYGNPVNFQGAAQAQGNVAAASGLPYQGAITMGGAVAGAGSTIAGAGSTLGTIGALGNYLNNSNTSGTGIIVPNLTQNFGATIGANLGVQPVNSTATVGSALTE